MTSDFEHGHPITIPARDGYPLAARIFGDSSDRVVVVSAATAVPQRFYRHFAGTLAEAGFAVVTYDYRGIENNDPVLAYSIADDKWGMPRSVDAMMGAYPNVERRHVAPEDAGLGKIGHMGFFRLGSEPFWNQVVEWFRER